MGVSDEKSAFQKAAEQAKAVIPTHGGLTVNLKCGILSEVYLEEGILDLIDAVDLADKEADRTARLLAYLIFHEWMHNKLDALEGASVDIHNSGGGGLAEIELKNVQKTSPDDILTKVNIKLMSAALGKSRPQCTARLT